MLIQWLVLTRAGHRKEEGQQVFIILGGKAIKCILQYLNSAVRDLFSKLYCINSRRSSFLASFKSRSGPSVGNTICSMWNETQADCLARVNEDFRRGIVVCPCNNECNEVTFSSTLSSSDWPSENFVRYLVDKLHRSAQSDVIVNILESEPNLTKEVLQRNFLQIEVYFSNLNFEQVTVTESFVCKMAKKS